MGERYFDKEPESYITLDFVQEHKKISCNLIVEPCEDCISRQAVLEAIDTKAWEFCDYLISKNRNDEQKPVSHFADNLRECIREELPSVNPQPKTGHWIKEKIIYGWDGHSYQCSVCGRSIHLDAVVEVLADYPYCHCGAKMV